MAKTIDAFYDVNAQYRPIEQGTYPAHINSFEIKSLNTRAGNAKVINMRYAIADEVSKQMQKEWEMNGYEYKVDGRGKRIPRLDAHGNQNEFSCEHMKGKEYRDDGIWIFLDANSMSKNSNYFNVLDALNIECPTIKKDGVEIKQLMEIEAHDVIGKAVNVKLSKVQFVTSETKHLTEDKQEKRTVMKVTGISEWSNGVDIPQDEIEEDTPF